MTPNIVSSSAVITASAANAQWLPSIRLLDDMRLSFGKYWCDLIRLGLGLGYVFVCHGASANQWHDVRGMMCGTCIF